MSDFEIGKLKDTLRLQQMYINNLRREMRYVYITMIIVLLVVALSMFI